MVVDGTDVGEGFALGEEFGVCGDVLWCLRDCMCVCVSTFRSRGAVCHRAHSVIGPPVDVHWELHNPLVRPWQQSAGLCVSAVGLCVCVALCCGVVAS